MRKFNKIKVLLLVVREEIVAGITTNKKMNKYKMEVPIYA